MCRNLGFRLNAIQLVDGLCRHKDSGQVSDLFQGLGGKLQAGMLKGFELQT